LSGDKDPRVIEAMRNVPRHLFVPEDILLISSTDGARMIIPVGEEGGIQELAFLKKEKGVIIKRVAIEALFVSMIGG